MVFPCPSNQLSMIVAALFEPIIQRSVGPFPKLAFKAALATNSSLLEMRGFIEAARLNFRGVFPYTLWTAATAIRDQRAALGRHRST